MDGQTPCAVQTGEQSQNGVDNGSVRSKSRLLWSSNTIQDWLNACQHDMSKNLARDTEQDDSYCQISLIQNNSPFIVSSAIFNSDHSVVEKVTRYIDVLICDGCVKERSFRQCL